MSKNNKKVKDCSFSSLKKRVNKQANDIEALNKSFEHLITQISKILEGVK